MNQTDSNLDNDSIESDSETQRRLNNRETNGVAIGMFLFAGVGILASSRHGFFGGLHHPIEFGIIISLMAGAVSGLLMFPQYRIAALTCVPFASLAGYLALDWYLPGRESVNTVEMVLVQCVAALPAIAAGNLIRIFVYNGERLGSSRNAR